MSQVWNTVELAEMILLHLPLRDLLCSRNVCRDWRGVHKGSEKIKVVLFLKPYRGYTLSLRNIEIKAADGTNEKVRTWMEAANPSNTQQNPIFNPFLNPFIHREDMEDEDEPSLRLMSDSFVLGFDAEKDDIFNPSEDMLIEFHGQPEASWRSMLLTQPAARLYLSWCPVIPKFFRSAGEQIAEHAKGVRIGMVYELLREHLKYCVSCHRSPGEIARCQWAGESCTDTISVKSTGWEMFAEIQKRSTI